MGCGDGWTRVKRLGTRLARIWAATRLSDHSGQYLHLLGQWQQVVSLVLEIRSHDVGLGKPSWVGSFLLFTRYPTGPMPHPVIHVPTRNSHVP